MARKEVNENENRRLTGDPIAARVVQEGGPGRRETDCRRLPPGSTVRDDQLVVKVGEPALFQ